MIPTPQPASVLHVHFSKFPHIGISGTRMSRWRRRLHGCARTLRKPSEVSTHPFALLHTVREVSACNCARTLHCLDMCVDKFTSTARRNHCIESCVVGAQLHPERISGKGWIHSSYNKLVNLTRRVWTAIDLNAKWRMVIPDSQATQQSGCCHS